jgi:hypothetical protein
VNGLVTRCRIFPGDWCSVCAQPDPHGDGRPAASDPGEVVTALLVPAADPDCAICDAEGRCVCVAPVPVTMTGGPA